MTKQNPSFQWTIQVIILLAIIMLIAINCGDSNKNPIVPPYPTAMSSSPTPTGLSAISFCQNVTEIPSQECIALVTLYNSTKGSGWTNQGNWKSTNTPCSWFGVTCNNDMPRHVTSLILNDNKLRGAIPAEIGNLTHLTRLDLYQLSDRRSSS